MCCGWVTESEAKRGSRGVRVVQGTAPAPEVTGPDGCHWAYHLPPTETVETECGETFRLLSTADLDRVIYCPFCGRRAKKPKARVWERQAAPGTDPFARS